MITYHKDLDSVKAYLRRNFLVWDFNIHLIPLGDKFTVFSDAIGRLLYVRIKVVSDNVDPFMVEVY